ncbi:hypothetical protein PRIPAC_81338 [Pristionchus pacificus]|uniref:ADP ribosylation factor n=1 Tax=Pristionchus pacificus TaxID=54126 RepID=A0A2A6CKM9_PRIPA|nr:hypothetical protein PRIPAC_81338 [Pristionchus pacificus]|eukprot:PDM78660.1 ADP ribosylation factor [Pristionchus pacificus]
MKAGYQELKSIDPEEVTITVPNIVTQFAISTRIDRSLQKEKAENINRVNILLLGGADAGKSTIVKQMRILHMNGFSDYDMRHFHKYLRRNIFQANLTFQIFHEVALTLQENPSEVHSESEETLVSRFAENNKWFLEIGESQEVEYLLDFEKLKCVQSYLEYFPNYSSLPDNAQYYIPKLSSLLSPDYVPTAEDILHLRVPTTAVHEINFFFGPTKIRVVDVGGQRTYRKKWIHCFEGVSAVMFVASMAAYDQALEKVDALIKPVMHAEIFQILHDAAHAKKDIFSKKLPSHPLDKYFNGYYGKNADDASEFLKDYFLKRKSSRDKDRTIYSHYTCATNTKNVEFVFKAVCDIILKKNLAISGIS